MFPISISTVAQCVTPVSQPLIPACLLVVEMLLGFLCLCFFDKSGVLSKHY